MNIQIEEYAQEHREWAQALLIENWGSTKSVSRGVLWDADQLPGFVAIVDGAPQGLLTYHIQNENLEIVTFNSLKEKMGIGTVLLNRVIEHGSSSGCKRVWLITTNDNTHSLAFYQKRGFKLAALHRDAMEESRKLKPEIPMIGANGIPIRDELELEKIIE